MAIVQNVYTGNGSTTLYSFTFPYLEESDVLVEVSDSLTTAYTFANATTIQFNTAPANGARVRIYRDTDIDQAQATFFPGSSIRSQDLNNNTTQALYAVQELSEQTVPKYNAVLPDDLSMGGNKITNLATPTSAQDAVNKTYADSTFVDVAGDTMTGQLNMGSNKIVNMAEPTSSHDAVTKNYVDTTFIDNTTDLIDSTETWVSNDSKVGTTAAHDFRHTMVVNPTIPTVPSGGWQVGKTWLQNDVNKTLSYWTGSNWSGITSGGTFTLQPTVIYVDSVTGDDVNDGHRIINPKKTIKNAVASAAAGDIIKVAPGVYQEVLPIDITVDNLSIVGDSQRSCFVHPTVATQEQIMFRCNSGTYIDGFTFVGLKASGARGGHPIDTDATYGLPASQGWVAGFYPGCIVKKSPYINNCTNFADASIDNSAFDPNNYAGTGGDLTSAPTGGGIIVDGSAPSVSSPLRSFVINEFTQVCLDGPGLLVCNNGYAQAVSFFGLFCHYHAKALNGGQINMEVGTTDFGRYGLIADGKSSSAIFTATANGGASAGATTFAINAPTAGGSWFGDATRPATNMLVQIGSDIYPILSATANGGGWNVTISRPDPADLASNLGLINSHANGASVSFFLRSMISTASHTMEYAGSGTNYNALPENGGVPVEANEAVNLNNGKVWLTSTDQNGKFKVGDTFQVNQQTGVVTIPAAASGGVQKTSSTGSAIVPTGSTVQRDASPLAGYFRFNTTNTSFEGYNGTAWAPVGGISDGDKGDITVSSNGTAWAIDNGVVGISKLSATGTPSATTFLRGDNSWVAVSPGGSNTQIQFNDSGAFGGDADLTYNKTSNVLTNKGDINLDDGGTYTTTIQSVTATANRTITFPNATGTVALVAGSSGQVTYNNAGVQAGGNLGYSTSTGTFGYTAGSGNVTQATNKSTGVTLDAPCGRITMNGAALSASTTVSFTLTNSSIAANDVLILNHVSAGTAGSYLLNAQAAAGSATINVRNITAGSLSEAIVIGFAIIKS
jgi:hypothetical protein